ncbi:hypothetical protein PQX77_016627 [Marasmius sp. AFHP31]|nr:hypothetical protein PQX77_016627 [Marasmius sp. AFHP31]
MDFGLSVVRSWCCEHVWDDFGYAKLRGFGSRMVESAWSSRYCIFRGSRVKKEAEGKERLEEVGDFVSLRATTGADLSVHVLECIKEGSLIQRIADLLPDLLGLTLIRRENILQRRTELARWPHQCGDYALQLRNFRSLLLAFEKRAMKGGNPNHDSNKEEEELYEALQDRGSAYFEDAGSVALPLTAHCPTLEVMGLERGFCSQFGVTRDTHGGGIRIHTGEYRFQGFTDQRDWDPYELGEGWKPVLPMEDAEESTRRRCRIRYRERVEELGIPDKSLDQPVDVTLIADDTQSVYDDLDAYRILDKPNDESFSCAQGELDLTGRHKQRFLEVSSTFHRLKDDLDAIRPTVKEEEYQEEDRLGEMRTCVEYIMKDEKLWEEFRLKWKVPRSIDYGGLQMWMGYPLKAARDAGNVPKFQKLLLTDLPSELIDHIFSLGTLRQARLLASTCKLLKEIGVSYLYHTRTLNLHGILSLRLTQHLELEDLDLGVFTKEQSEAMVRQAAFLLSRPDLTDAIQNLNIADGWKQDFHLYKIPDLGTYAYGQTIYHPINASLNAVLSSCQSLTHLTICYWAITSDWLITISQLRNLHTLNLRFARIQDPTVEADIIHGRVPLSPHILNVWWCEGEEWEYPLREPSGEGLWYLLILFPNLLTFGHDGIQNEVWLPCHSIQERCCHLWQSLRRLNLNVCSLLVPELTTWASDSRLRASAACMLTHLKLHTIYPVSESDILPLLEVIATAPLEVLVLEGIKEGSLALFQHIATLFPDLLGLTIIRRENVLQRETKMSRWPHQCWEYALQLQNFRRLKYFGWNYYVPLHDISPVVLLELEELAAREARGESDGNESFDFDCLDGRESVYFHDTGSIALPLAAHCPTLEIMGLETGYCAQYSVSRESGGITINGRYGVSTSVADRRDWNPVDDGWKPIFPSEHEDQLED